MPAALGPSSCRSSSKLPADDRATDQGRSPEPLPQDAPSLAVSFLSEIPAAQSRPIIQRRRQFAADRSVRHPLGDFFWCQGLDVDAVVTKRLGVQAISQAPIERVVLDLSRRFQPDFLQRARPSSGP